MRSRGTTFRLAFSAVLTALAVIFLLAADLLPTAQLALCCFAGFFVGAAVATFGYGAGLMCWAAASALGLIVLPAKGSALLFLLMFGIYPVLKGKAERLGRPVLVWAVKLIYCNVMLAVCLLGLSALLFPGAEAEPLPLPALWLACVGVFLLYDVTFTRVMIFYQGRILPVLLRQK